MLAPREVVLLAAALSAAGCVTAAPRQEATRAEEPAPPAGPPGGAAPPPGADAPRSADAVAKREGGTQIGASVVGIVLLEGLFAGYGALAARWPGVGWGMLLCSPLAAGSGEARPGSSGALQIGLAGGGALLGLYDALVFPRSHFSRSERFWQNVAAWNAILVGSIVAEVLTFDEEAASGAKSVSVSLGAGVVGDWPAVVVAGRF